MSSSKPVFDHGTAGQRIGGERRDQPGDEYPEENDLTEEEAPAERPHNGFVDDSLYHPDRVDDGSTFVWPRDPRRG